ncbi:MULTISPECIES: DUF1127 domain-containing protein [Thalassospira]|uniref:DUF1127 domain-containing protein n=2 Tax=Thalassospira TaxID=168934 RepID=A0A367W012_9PROT|nr:MULTISPECIES: DUF1127 domain-containing protein [Thalassospira]MDG4720317.1 DUF1127 domain-containing protein [Thalassospira sp. FZY0004]RCK32189.1 hypothetical protein TH19_19910 [Thalassospira profundimaris]
MAHQVSAHDRFDITTDPIAKRMPFGALFNRIVKYSVEARKRKNQREVLSTLNDAQLLDVGLERKFDGERWYVERISQTSAAPTIR